ncbi:hypothetical protein D3C72_1806330 [compost metagenome]
MRGEGGRIDPLGIDQPSQDQAVQDGRVGRGDRDGIEIGGEHLLGHQATDLPRQGFADRLVKLGQPFPHPRVPVSATDFEEESSPIGIGLKGTELALEDVGEARFEIRGLSQMADELRDGIDLRLDMSITQG